MSKKLYEVIKNIPPPKKHQRYRWKKLAQQMKPGCAMLVASMVEASAMHRAISTYFPEHKARIQKQPDETYLVWLLPKGEG